MKKMLTFVPLGIGISAAILYIFNIVTYRIVNNSATTLQIMASLKTYLYISILSFIVYFLIKVIVYINSKSYDYERDTIIDTKPKTNEKVVEVVENKVYPQEKTFETKSYPQEKILEKEIIKEVILTGNKYCDNCGEKIFDIDRYCKNCGSFQLNKKSGKSPLVKNIISVLEIVILILILYFLLNMLFEYKEKTDPKFESPFKVNITK